MVESRFILYSLISGLISGSVGGGLTAVAAGKSLSDFMYSLTYHQLISAGFPSANASALAKSISLNTGYIYWLIPLGAVINMLFLGVLMGLLMDYLVGKGLRPLLSALIAGCVLIFGLQLAPLYMLNLYYGEWFLQTIEEYINLWVILTPSLIYTAVLSLLVSVRGPWVKLEESKPEAY